MPKNRKRSISGIRQDEQIARVFQSINQKALDIAAKHGAADILLGVIAHDTKSLNCMLRDQNGVVERGIRFHCVGKDMLSSEFTLDEPVQVKHVSNDAPIDDDSAQAALKGLYSLMMSWRDGALAAAGIEWGDDEAPPALKRAGELLEGGGSNGKTEH